MLGLKFVRMPVCNSSSPTDEDYDLLTSALQGTKFNAPVILTCQVGLSRSTTGSVIACLFREYQVRKEELNFVKVDQFFQIGEKFLRWPH